MDGVEWIAVKPLIISIIASSPTRKEIYGLDRRMNFHRSCDSGETWRQITDGYVKEVREETNLVRAKSLPENLVSHNPTPSFTVIANSTGITWGVSGAGIHIMTIGDHSWSMVGSWKCCGLWTLGPKSLHLHGNLIRHTREYMELGSWEGANKQIEILWVFNTNAWNEVILSYDLLHA